MTEAAQLALIGMLATVLIPTMAGAWLSWMSYLKSRQNATAISELHIIVNDRLTQLLAATAAAQRAEGVIEGARSAGTAAASRSGDQDRSVAGTDANTAAIVANTAATDRNTEGGRP